MIDYDTFQFACLPETGGTWFYQTLKSVGVPIKKVEFGGIYSNFPKDRNGTLLRVSMVRHPCDWLSACYQLLNNVQQTEHHPECLFSFMLWTGGIKEATLNDFIIAYLQHMPGHVSKLMLGYQADSYIPIEEMPWAMVEFLEMMGYRRPNTFPPTTTLQLIPTMDDDLRRQVVNAEREMCDAFDYY